MASDAYVNVDNDRTPSGISWRVGTWGEKLYVYVGGSLVCLEGEQRDRFTEAVARTAMPGQVKAAQAAAPEPEPYTGHLRFPAIPAGPDDLHRLRTETAEALGELAGRPITASDAADSGDDCGRGLGAERCRAAEDGDLGD